MNKGWIKIHRSICDNIVFTDPDVLRLWIWFLCNAAYEEHEIFFNGKSIKLYPGDVPFGRKMLAKKMRTTESKVYRTTKKLEMCGKVNIKSNNKFSIASIVNWGKYQDRQNESEQQFEQQTNNRRTTNRTTNEQQTNTTKEGKEIKEYKEGEEVRARSREDTPPTPPTTLEEIRLFCSERNSSVNPVRFYNYNASRNWQGVADWKLKIEEWEQNEYASEDKAKADKLGAYMSAGRHGEELDLGAFDEAVSDGGWTYEV